jgi:hypothetical protein
MNTGEMVASRRRPGYCDFGQAIVPSLKGHASFSSLPPIGTWEPLEPLSGITDRRWPRRLRAPVPRAPSLPCPGGHS